MEICSLINRLIKYALKNSLITDDDVILVRNELMALLHLKDWQNVKEDNQILEYPQEILNKICDYAVKQKIIAVSYTHLDVYKRQQQDLLHLQEFIVELYLVGQFQQF